MSSARDYGSLDSVLTTGPGIELLEYLAPVKRLSLPGLDKNERSLELACPNER